MLGLEKAARWRWLSAPCTILARMPQPPRFQRSFSSAWRVAAFPCPESADSVPLRPCAMPRRHATTPGGSMRPADTKSPRVPRVAALCAQHASRGD
ncbi:hypothetical protein HYPSUDRAFT_66830 [Hypholoma sublateritium FD-334 SS-4]|uniref:Uncharacterized protein n=1 Tax=Hypholoma sublateritium (strain FD-334 SS-4) TaxID=945553 RepID=A0A0D2P1L9_HYPSF|nr:hypothetical protein HYPSUDRAFT_66830 [Hypholoma sublateritium FD-334 SS-4]